MGKTERIREVLTSPLDNEYIQAKATEGWRPVAVEWERGAGGETIGEAGAVRVELPYGLCVADDCLYLQENDAEMRAMMLMLKLICEDRRHSEVAAEVNAEGFRTRQGTEWTQTAIFQMLPRLIEVAPRIYGSQDWLERKPNLQRVV